MNNQEISGKEIANQTEYKEKTNGNPWVSCATKYAGTGNSVITKRKGCPDERNVSMHRFPVNRQ